jgi:RNA polymerase sigma-70 factor (ECF subfamily)
MTAGDEEAFVRLYRRYQRRVFRFALLMSGCPAAADDVTQEVFLALLRESDQYDPSRGALLNYLYGIARKQVLRALDRNRTLTQLANEAVDSWLCGGGDSPGRILDRSYLAEIAI